MVVVDRDESREEARETQRLLGRYPQWKWSVSFTGGPHGIVAALNQGIDLVECPLTARHDDDDRSHPGRLDIQSRCFADDPSLIVLGTQLAYVRDGRLGVRRYATDHASILAEMPLTNPLGHPTTMVRTGLLQALHYRRRLYCEDYDLWIRAADRGRFRNLEEPLVTYRIKNDDELRAFEHGPVFRAHVRLKFEHRKRFQLSPGAVLGFYGLLFLELVFSITPRWCYRLFYKHRLYP